MIQSRSFWIAMTVFQALFAVTIFAVTRQYYIQDSDKLSAEATVVRQPSLVWPDSGTEMTPAELKSSTFSQSTSEDPAELSRQANEFFASQQYDRAAVFYERLLAFGPNNVDTYNNLGITLHYLGRSTEALRKLNDGVGVDSTNQRIWLTLGFVNSEVGNTEQARTALSTAASMDPDNEIGQSAAKLLANLP